MIEIIVVCAVVSLLIAIAVPGIKHVIEKKQCAAIASQFRLAAQAFELCKLTTGSYPPDATPRVVPDGMQTFFDELNFAQAGLNWATEENIIGGRWDWDLDQFGYHAGVSIYQPNVSIGRMTIVDRILDDGNLDTGHFRRRSQGYMLIMED